MKVLKGCVRSLCLGHRLSPLLSPAFPAIRLAGWAYLHHFVFSSSIVFPPHDSHTSFALCQQSFFSSLTLRPSFVSTLSEKALLPGAALLLIQIWRSWRLQKPLFFPPHLCPFPGIPMHFNLRFYCYEWNYTAFHSSVYFCPFPFGLLKIYF